MKPIETYAWRAEKGASWSVDLIRVLCPLCGALHLHGALNFQPEPHCHGPEKHVRPNHEGYSVVKVLPGAVPDEVLRLAGKAERAWWNVVYRETPRALEKAKALAEQARGIISDLKRRTK